jgi:hypothetical protein
MHCVDTNPVHRLRVFSCCRRPGYRGSGHRAQGEASDPFTGRGGWNPGGNRTGIGHRCNFGCNMRRNPGIPDLVTYCRGRAFARALTRACEVPHACKSFMPRLCLLPGVVKSRRASWSSKPVAGRVAGRGGFDSHPLPLQRPPRGDYSSGTARVRSPLDPIRRALQSARRPRLERQR